MKPSIAVYHYNCLPQSETFIYRQILGLGERFRLKLLTEGVDNEAEFPGLAPVLLPRPGLVSRLLGWRDRFIAEQLKGSRLLHVNFGHFALEMERHARRAGIPATAYFLGVDASAFLKDPGYCKRLRESRFAAVFVNSQDMKRRLSPHLPPGMPCRVAYCGIPLERFPFRQRHRVPEGGRFLQVGRLCEKKGIDVTLKAFSRYCRERDPRAELVVAGDGPLKGDLCALSEALGISDRVRFVGAVGYRSYLELLDQADVFLHPSVTARDGDMEGLPTAICEAMACGLPVVSTRHSGIPEIVDDGVDGFLADEGDPEGLYRSILDLTRGDVRDVSRQARAKIEARFDQTRTVAVLADYLNDIMDGDRRGK